MAQRVVYPLQEEGKEAGEEELEAWIWKSY